jgi:excisionase family DNA binding protein
MRNGTQEDTTLLRAAEVAAYLRLNIQTVRRLLRSGDIPGVRLGRLWHVRQVDLDAALQRKTGEPSDSSK